MWKHGDGDSELLAPPPPEKRNDVLSLNIQVGLPCCLEGDETLRFETSDF